MKKRKMQGLVLVLHGMGSEKMLSCVAVICKAL